MQNNCESTYYMLIVDRAGNSYTVSGVGLDVLPDALLRYINGEIDTCTPEILYHYCDLATTITYGFADSDFSEYALETAKLLCWLKEQYTNGCGNTPFFKDNNIKRDIVNFYDYYCSLNQKNIAESNAIHGIRRKLRNIFPKIAEKYLDWDYLYEIKKISTIKTDIEPEKD